MKMRSRFRAHLAVATVLGLFVAAPVQAASLTQVSDWGASGVPSYLKMYIYVPDRLATKPPILVSAHSCGSTATGQMGNIPKIKAAADANGFILILPDNPGQNCWDVGAKDTSLQHDAGGDTKGVVQMVKYALTKYNGDASRVYAMGGSSGGMLTQALMAVYPDVFRAGHARAGVPAGCWAESYDPAIQWSGPCATGTVSKTAEEWGDLVRAMYTGYTGHRPRIQIVQGDMDQTISFKNSAEAVKEWTNVLGLSATPSSTGVVTTSIATYSQQFWKNACDYVVLETWAGNGGKHSMGYEEDALLKFFGLDQAGGADPEPDCGGGGNGTGGASSTGGAGGTGSSVGGSPASGGTGPAAGAGGSPVVGAGGSGSEVAGAPNTGVAGSGAGGSGAGGSGAGGSDAGGSDAGGSGGSVSGVAGAPDSAAGTDSTAAGATGDPGIGGGNDSGGCALVAPSQSKLGLGAIALGLSLLALVRRRRRAQS